MSLESKPEKKSNLPCTAPISKIRVEKIEGGIVVAGVVVAANCQIALPVFGCLFVLAGIVLTVASYRGPGQDEEPENYAARLAFTGNSRILGPACIVVGIIMLLAGIGVCFLAKSARKKKRRVGFHCPIHGDFYPLGPISAPKAINKYKSVWEWCFGKARNFGVEGISLPPPQCPHTQLSSTRSSFSAPTSLCPTPLPFLVTSNSISNNLVISVAASSYPDQNFGSISSLSVSKEVASFPLSRTPSPPLTSHERSNNLSNPLSVANSRIIQKEDEPSETESIKSSAQDLQDLNSSEYQQKNTANNEKDTSYTQTIAQNNSLKKKRDIESINLK